MVCGVRRSASPLPPRFQLQRGSYIPSIDGLAVRETLAWTLCHVDPHPLHAPRAAALDGHSGLATSEMFGYKRD